MTKNFMDIISDMGAAGLQVTELAAAEGAAGNISVFVDKLEGIPASYQSTGIVDLPVPAPDLAGGWAVVSGSGKRLRDIKDSPEKNVCIYKILEGGVKGELFIASTIRPTSEFNSHLAIHQDQVARRKLGYHAVLHAQSEHLTFLSHIPRYSNTRDLNRRLLRWEPETILIFPEGIGLIPFEVPGTQALMKATVAGLQTHKIVIWQRHGQVVRSDESVTKAANYIEYAETAATYEYFNLTIGEPTEGISIKQILDICKANEVDQVFFSEEEI